MQGSIKQSQASVPEPESVSQASVCQVWRDGTWCWPQLTGLVPHGCPFPRPPCRTAQRGFQMNLTRKHQHKPNYSDTLNYPPMAESVTWHIWVFPFKNAFQLKRNPDVAGEYRSSLFSGCHTHNEASAPADSYLEYYLCEEQHKTIAVVGPLRLVRSMRKKIHTLKKAWMCQPVSRSRLHGWA